MEKDKIEIPFGAFDSELGGWEYTIPEGFEAEIKDGKIIVRKSEREDEKIRKKTLAYFKENQHEIETYHHIVVGDIINWLENLGEQKLTDNEMIEILRVEYEKGRANAIVEMQNPAWSEEDESRMNNLCHFLEEYGTQYYGYLTLQGTISWLKSLKKRLQPHPTWKPSEEQIRYLQAVVNNINNTGSESCHIILKELLKQLKTLI